MKYINCIMFFLILSFGTFSQNSDTIIVNDDVIILSRDTIIRNNLSEMNLDRFVGLKASVLLNNDTVNQYNDYFWVCEPPGKLQSLYLKYSSGLYIIIYTKERPFSKKRKWKLKDYRNYTITHVRFKKTYFDKCIGEEK